MKYNLFSINLNNYEIDYISYLNANNHSPILSPDKSTLLFTSDLNGVDNLYEIPVTNGGFSKSVNKISEFISSVFNPVYIDSNHITFSGFENFSFNLYIFDRQNALKDSIYSIAMKIDEPMDIWKANITNLPSEKKEKANDSDKKEDQADLHSRHFDNIPFTVMFK